MDRKRNNPTWCCDQIEEKIKAHRIGTCGTFCSNCKKSDARAFNQYIKYCWFCGAEFDIKK